MGLSGWVSKWFGASRAERTTLPEAEERDYALEELAAYDGSDSTRPLLVAIRGEVYDVTRGRDFYGPGGPYEMFAGKDCTRALAKMSFEAEDFIGEIDGLDQDELDKLEEWIEMFSAKYRRIGQLLEP